MIIKTFENFNSLVKKQDHYQKGSNVLSEDEVELRKICSDITTNDFTDEDVKSLNRISGYNDFYNVIHDWLENEFRIFKKYSLVDIEDRFVEYSDKLLRWESLVMFSLSRKNATIGISESKLNDVNYFYQTLKSIIKDISYVCSSSYNRLTVDQYLSETKASIYFKFYKHKSHESYNLGYVEKIMLEFEKRMSNMYRLNITYGESSSENRKLRGYDTNIDVYDYSLTMNLRRR